MKILILFFLLFSPITYLAAQKSTEQVSSFQVRSDSELEGVVNLALQLPEVQAVLDEVLKDGPIQVKKNKKYSSEFEGYWEDWTRTIYITKDRYSSNGTLLSTFMHELHNAYRNSDLSYYNELARQHKISKKKYVRAIEYVEFLNARDSSRLLALGIERGIYPKDARWDIPEDFEVHYKIQRQSGHSAYIARSYDYLT